jgi:hypothetical protein
MLYCETVVEQRCATGTERCHSEFRREREQAGERRILPSPTRVIPEFGNLEFGMEFGDRLFISPISIPLRPVPALAGGQAAASESSRPGTASR